MRLEEALAAKMTTSPYFDFRYPKDLLYSRPI